MRTGTPAEAFIKILSFCVEDGFVERVLADPNPFHEWESGHIGGSSVIAREMVDDLSEVYRDFLDD